VEADVPLAGRQDSLRVLGFDPLRAAQVQPGLLPERAGMAVDLFDADAILLSPAAARWLALEVGDELKVTVGSSTVALRVGACCPKAPTASGWA
jgi:putative ABC transport system permease protein